jgi:hypothetical protein
MGNKCVYDETSERPLREVMNFAEFVGKFHPLLVHLPIGFVTLALVLSLVLKKANEELISLIFKLAFLVAVMSILTGLAIPKEGEYDESLINWHLWSAVIFTLLVGITGWGFRKWAMVGSGIFMLIAGHGGGSLTHGSDYLIFWKGKEENLDIHPVLASHCVSCHNADRKKGELRLDVGEIDEKIVGEIQRRIELPLNHKEHMPPKGKKQLTEDELESLKKWQMPLPELPSVSPEDILALGHSQIKYIPKNQGGNYFHIELNADFEEFPNNFQVIAEHILGIQAEGIPLRSEACEVILNLKNLRRFSCIDCKLDASCQETLEKMAQFIKKN